MADSPPWLPFHLQPFWGAELPDVLRALIVGEAENQSYMAMLAVAYTATNRRRYAERGWVRWFSADSDTENILARAQFSCFWASWGVRGPALTRALHSPSRYPTANRAALACVNGTEADPTIGPDGLGADFYWDDSIAAPYWATPTFNADGSLSREGYMRTAKIGAFTFCCSVA